MKIILLFFIISVVKSEVPYLSILQYEQITMADQQTICSYFSGANVTENCWEQLEVVCENTTLLMTIFDASAKFPYAGLTYSSKSDYGNFDECLSVDHTYSGGRILGEYCAVGLLIAATDNPTTVDDFFQLAVCRPNACSANDYRAILEYANVSLPGSFADGLCVTSEGPSFTAGDISVLTLFAVIIAIMAASTIYDIYLYRSQLKSAHPLLTAFSVYSNGRKLLHISKHSKSKEQIETFHGMRAISMMWIVAGHDFAMWPYTPVTDVGKIQGWPNQMSAFYITAAPLSVDTFFFMSGFLLAFQYFKSKARSLGEQVSSVPHMIIHRYLRLTPAMLMVYLVVITFYKHLGSGPIYPGMSENFSNVCTTYWWRFFLYIQNYYDFSDMCLPQTWYLSADMQLFLISPLVLIPVSLQLKHFGFRSAMVVLLILNIIWTFLPMVIRLVFRDYTNDYDTHSRLIDYFIGVMLGLHMRANIDKPFFYMLNESRRYVVNLITWPLIILGMLAVIICYQDQSANHGYESITVFQALMRPAWCIGLSWITYSCYHGQGGFVNWILCRPIFQVLGRLTYCIYLIHISVIMYYMGTSRMKWHFSEYQAFYHFCGHYVVSLILATFWTLAFESPLITIEKYFLGGAKPTKEKSADIENGANSSTLKN